MLCCRIAAGGLALLAASVVNTSAQSCLPWACQESRSSARATDASSTQNARNNLPSSRRDQRKLSAAQSQQRVARRELMSANGMVRPCSCPPQQAKLARGDKAKEHAMSQQPQAVMSDFGRRYRALPMPAQSNGCYHHPASVGSRECDRVTPYVHPQKATSLFTGRERDWSLGHSKGI